MSDMWREFFSRFPVPIQFTEPATDTQLVELETSLQITLPDELRSLLREANGTEFAMKMPGELAPDWFVLFWSVEEMQKENQAFREIVAHSATDIPPLNTLLFFSSLTNGDPVALPRADAKANSLPVFSISHENYHERRVQFSSMKELFACLLETAANYQ